ncbi:hypothetical protein [Shewanella salipaludis]|uniref:Uncharacterized protein n=1 Tax=Shewanella salipaludis TaxID=2723052 RepID=A0A972FTQ5_9GAMM|nr:hypothetical protein [Shewanella salipaludis]NMH65104.1 hypothetical protein [Shewanella salipaludis]
MKKISIAILIAVTTYIYFSLADNASDSIETTHHRPTAETKLTKDKEPEEGNITLSVMEKIIKKDEEKIKNPDIFPENKKYGELNEKDFVDANSFTNVFVLENDIVSKDALKRFFTIENVHELIYKVKSIPPTELSETREYQLTQMLKVFKDTHYYAESYACAGKICAMSFNYDELNKEELAEFSHFSENYTFTNATVNEFGEKQLKAVYIATDDPSQLTVR